MSGDAAPKKRPEGVPESMQAAVWAPDLRWLVLVADGRFAVIDPSRPRREAGRLPSLPQFSRGGARAVTVRGAQVVVWAVAR